MLNRDYQHRFLLQHNNFALYNVFRKYKYRNTHIFTTITDNFTHSLKKQPLTSIMFKKILFPFLLLATISVQAQTKKPVPVKKKPVTTTKTTTGPTKILKTVEDSVSYAMGISVAQFLKAQGFTNINNAVLSKAIDDVLKNGKPVLTDMQANSVMERSARARAMKKINDEKEKGQQFLAQNKKKAGIMETATGLQYEILVAGNGPKPTEDDTISAHYAGKLLNGKEFDNSYTRGQPITLPVTGVIRGWTEALQMMPVGSKWRLYIPSVLGYGDRGAGQDIPGGATLVFDVELLGITNKDSKK